MPIVELDDDMLRAMRERDALLAEQVKIVEGYIVVNVSYEYNINLETINSAQDVLGWVFHLTEKTWMNTDVLRRFIQVACGARGIEYRN